MRVKAGPDGARARRHVSTRRPDIGGTFPYDALLLRHRGSCREQHQTPIAAVAPTITIFDIATS